MKNTKRAQYLTLDAFIASIIVASGLMLVLAARASVPNTVQSELLSKDFSSSLSSLKLKEINNPLILNMSKSGTINNMDNTVMQQVAEFYFINQKTNAFKLIQNVTYGLIPPQYSFSVLVNDEMIFNRTLASENTSTVLVASRRLIFGVINKTAAFYGPTVAEVRVWQ
jgi:hypothetical protein